MARALIPRSDSVSAKIIEPSDFENLFSADIVQDYIKSGFTLSAGSGLACNVAAGVIRFKGLYLENDATEAVTVSASATNAIYVKINRDGNDEAESWTFSISSSGDTFHIGNAVTDGSGVTSTNTSNNPNTKPGVFALNTALGGGTSGDVLYSNGTNWTKLAKGSDGDYLKLASGIPSWVALPDLIGTMTVQRAELSSNSNSTTETAGGTDLLSITLPSRTGGKFMATANLIMGGGDPVKLRFIDGATTKNYIVAGSISGHGRCFSLSLTGSLSGQVIKINASHDDSDDARQIYGDSTNGYSHMEVIEVSPA